MMKNMLAITLILSFVAKSISLLINLQNAAPSDLRLEKVTIFSVIENRFAQTKISVEVTNPSESEQKTNFVWFIPNNALVSTLLINDADSNKDFKLVKAEETQEDVAFLDDLLPEVIVPWPRDAQLFRVPLTVAASGSTSLSFSYDQVVVRVHHAHEYDVLFHSAETIKSLHMDVNISELYSNITNDPKLSFLQGFTDNRRLKDLEGYSVERLVDERKVRVTYSSTSEQLSNLNEEQSDMSLNANHDALASYVEEGNRVSTTEQRLSIFRSRPCRAKGRTAGGVTGVMRLKFIVTAQEPDMHTSGDMFIHRFHPPLTEAMSREMLLVVHTGTSMENPAAMQFLNQSIVAFFESLTTRDRFTVLTFNSQETIWSESFVHATAEATTGAKQYLKEKLLQLKPGLQVRTAVLKALRLFAHDKTNSRHLVFLGDEDTTLDASSKSNILNDIHTKNKGKVSISALAQGPFSGDNMGTPFLQQLAHENNGLFASVPSYATGKETAFHFFRKLQNPLLSHLDLDIFRNRNGSNHHHFDSTYFNGSEVIFSGLLMHQPRHLPAGSLKIEGSAHNGRRYFSYSLPCLNCTQKNTSHDLATRSVISQWRFMNLTDAIGILRACHGTCQRRKESVLYLSRKYGYLTDQTTMLSEDGESMKLSPIRKLEGGHRRKLPQCFLPCRAPLS